MDWQALIAAQPALKTVPAGLRKLAERQELAAGEMLFRIGDAVCCVLSVVAGEIRLVRRSRDGAEVILQRSRGGFIAEASLSSAVYHCDVVAAEKSVTLRFPVRAFRNALDEDTGFRAAWMTHLAREVRKLRAQCERLSLHGAAERVIHYLESEGAAGTFELSQSRKAWAAELGLTHEALYRTLRRLQTEGRLTIDGPRLALVTPRRTGRAAT